MMTIKRKCVHCVESTVAMSNLRNAKLRKGNLRKIDAKLACDTG